MNGRAPGQVDETPYGYGRDRTGVKRIAPDKRRGIYYWTIRLAEDEWIVPSDSAVLAGASSMPGLEIPSHLTETSPGNFLFKARRILTGQPDHCSLLRDKKIADFILTLLEFTDRQH